MQPTHNSTQTLLMIRPQNFGSNPQTLLDNAFQQQCTNQDQAKIKEQAIKQFDNFVQLLRKEGVEVIVVQDRKQPVKPDAVFPNNWISTLRDGRVVVYPMKPASRRVEKTNPVIQQLKKQGFKIKQIIDWSKYENSQPPKFLQGTGSMIFDHQNKIGYACKSQRTSQQLFNQFCQEVMGYKSVCFDAFDSNNVRYYHTNVIMSVCSDFVIICLQCVPESQRQQILTSITQSKKHMIEITRKQVSSFCGNVLQVHNKQGQKILTMGEDAYNAFTQEQLQTILKYCKKIRRVNLPTIQAYGGGGSRCMMCEVFLTRQ